MRTKVIKYHTLSELELHALARNLIKSYREISALENPLEPAAAAAPVPEGTIKTILAAALRELPRE